MGHSPLPEEQRGGSEGPPTRPSAKLRSPGAWQTCESSRDSGRIASQTRCGLQPELTWCPVPPAVRRGKAGLFTLAKPGLSLSRPDSWVFLGLGASREIYLYAMPLMGWIRLAVLVLCQGPYLSVLSAPPARC